MNLRQPLPDTEGGLIDFLERRRVVAAKTLVVNMWKKRQRGILTGEVVTPAYEELQLITQAKRWIDSAMAGRSCDGRRLT